MSTQSDPIPVHLQASVRHPLAGGWRGYVSYHDHQRDPRIMALYIRVDGNRLKAEGLLEHAICRRFDLSGFFHESTQKVLLLMSNDRMELDLWEGYLEHGLLFGRWGDPDGDHGGFKLWRSALREKEADHLYLEACKHKRNVYNRSGEPAT
jgi:hypothetical protein